MVEGVNRQVVLAARPVGYPQEQDFQVRDAPMPALGERQVLVRNLWLSLDPYQRGRMSDAPSYTPSAEIGDVMTGGTVGRIVASNSGDFATGEIVQGQLGWQDYAVSNGSNLRKLDPSQAPVSTALGILGMPGLTAYFGLFEVGRPKPGDTVVVSAASGAVGAVVGQLAKMAGCRVVGTAGTQQKIDYITGELGFDAGINYKTEDVGIRLEEACPDGVDVYFDNVGGFVTDAVMEVLAYRARIAICGQISQYNLETPDNGPRKPQEPADSPGDYGGIHRRPVCRPQRGGPAPPHSLGERGRAQVQRGRGRGAAKCSARLHGSDARRELREAANQDIGRLLTAGFRLPRLLPHSW